MSKGLALSKDVETYSYGEHQNDSVCDNCGETFLKPILATISTAGGSQKYYACPRCLTKITEVEHRESEENKEIPFSIKNVKKATEKDGDSLECKHFLGYLKKRARDMPIPDECLTCDRMIQCLAH